MGARWTRAPIKSPPPGRRGLSSAPQPDRRIKLRTLMVGACMGQVEAEYCSSLFSLCMQPSAGRTTDRHPTEVQVGEAAQRRVAVDRVQPGQGREGDGRLAEPAHEQRTAREERQSERDTAQGAEASGQECAIDPHLSVHYPARVEGDKADQ